jgi:hypothetical protein
MKRVVYLMMIPLIGVCVSVSTYEKSSAKGMVENSTGLWDILLEDQESEYVVLTYSNQKIKIKLPPKMENFVKHGYKTEAARFTDVPMTGFVYKYNNKKYLLFVESNAPKVLGIMVRYKSILQEIYVVSGDNRFIPCDKNDITCFDRFMSF